MFEMKQVGAKTYYLKNATNIGIYLENEKDAWIIDTGNDKEAGKKILKIINEKEWNVVGIINTHSNADHIGGNKVIEDRTNCKILANNIEMCMTKFPILEPSFLYGGYPFNDLMHKFLMATPSKNVLNVDGNLPKGLEYINLPGHYFDQIGIKTSDNVYFLGDSIFSEEIIKKYHFFFIYDVKSYLQSLKIINNLNGNFYIPSHAPAVKDISNLVKINNDKIIEISNYILKFCEKKHSFEQILKQVFDYYNLTMNSEQYVLVGSTIRSYLSYLYNDNKLTFVFENNEMLWSTVV